MGGLKLSDLIDVNILQKIQDAFSEFTGMAALLTDEEGVPITEGSGFTDFCTNLTRKSVEGCRRCEECDKNGALATLENGRPTTYYCHAGLVDFASPVMLQGKLIGSFIGGQVRTAPINEEEMRKKAADMDIDGDVYIAAASKTNLLSKEEIDKAAVFLYRLTKVISEMAYKNYESLEKSRKKERMTRSQNTFILDMSQNIQSEMQSWMDVVEQALAHADSEEMKREMEKMEAHGTELYTAIEDTVAYIRMSGGEVELRETEYSIAMLLERTVRNAVRYLGWKKDNILVEIGESVPEILLGDSGRIGQIINKLLQNREHYEGQPIVAIQVQTCVESYSTILELHFFDVQGTYMEEQFAQLDENLEEEYGEIPEDTSNYLQTMIHLLVQQMAGAICKEAVENGETNYIIRIPQLRI